MKILKTFSLLVACLISIESSAFDSKAYESKELDQPKITALMPMPKKVKATGGVFVGTPNFEISLGAHPSHRMVLAKERALLVLKNLSGLTLANPSDGSNQLSIQIQSSGSHYLKLKEDESYTLQVKSGSAQLTAANEFGALHGLQTFLHLVQPNVTGFTVPAVVIHDQPRFPWRGLLLDSARHFIPVKVIERNLDGMEAVKLNVLHWHLSDDQGFRVESTRFPKLTENNLDGLFYTKAQIREVVEYASLRGIRVVPEFDMPGHTSSWIGAYPELASGKANYHTEKLWITFDAVLNPTKESTFQFIDQLISEMSPLFPDPYFHTGGDECNGKEWDANPEIQAFMKSRDLKNNRALQAYFTNRVQKIVTKYHKIPEGWNEVLDVTTPKNVVIQAWDATGPLAESAKLDYPSLLSCGYYLDLNQSAAEHYAVDPEGAESANLSDAKKKNILGGEAALWAEFVSAENIDGKLWPRAAAIAERLWSDKTVTDQASMHLRLAAISQKLEAYGLRHITQYGLMLRRIMGSDHTEHLQVLADVMQPPRIYVRHDFKDADLFTPLIRLVDAIHPESDQARRFTELCAKYASLHATEVETAELKNSLTLWRDNDAELQKELTKNELTRELIPVSASLRQVSEMGLKALQEISTHRRSSKEDLKTQLAELTKAYEPIAALVNESVPGVKILVEMAAH